MSAMAVWSACYLLLTKCKELSIRITEGVIASDPDYLWLMGKLEQVFNPIILVQFIYTNLTLCLAMFLSIQFEEFDIRVAQAMFITVQLTVQMLLFCWLGTELSTQAESVRTAVYACHWPDAGRGFMTCVLIVVSRCDRLFSITAGKFVDVSLVTMVNTFKETFSYMMVMINLVESVDEVIGNSTVALDH